ncbi:MAG: serine protease [Rubripirellula sp.]
MIHTKHGIGLLQMVTTWAVLGDHGRYPHKDLPQREATKMAWDSVVARFSDYLFRIETQDGAGTGFLCAYNIDKTFCGIATAAHVVDEAEKWHQSIRLRPNDGGDIVFLEEEQRIIFIDRSIDSAFIMVPTEELNLPDELIPLLPTDQTLPIGTEVGWLGYPAIENNQACFFNGPISARRDHRSAYLIDGVAINGVSGGPVFYSTPSHGVQIVGSISAYIANRSTGDALPGLLVAQDVSHFNSVIETIKSVDDAKQKKQEETQKQNSEDEKEG